MTKEKKRELFLEHARKLFAKALDVWDDDFEKVLRFLTKPNRALPHDRAPLMEVWHDGQKGLERVLNLLGRIEHGIYS